MSALPPCAVEGCPETADPRFYARDRMVCDGHWPLPVGAVLRCEQPPPRPGTGDVWTEVIAAAVLDSADPRLVADMRQRRELGIRRYGQALQRGDGRDHLVDAYEEALDLCVYLASALGADHEEAVAARATAARIRQRLTTCGSCLSLRAPGPGRCTRCSISPGVPR